MAYKTPITDDTCDTITCGHRAQYEVYSFDHKLIGGYCYYHAVDVQNEQNKREEAIRKESE